MPFGVLPETWPFGCLLLVQPVAHRFPRFLTLSWWATGNRIITRRVSQPVAHLVAYLLPTESHFGCVPQEHTFNLIFLLTFHKSFVEIMVHVCQEYTFNLILLLSFHRGDTIATDITVTDTANNITAPAPDLDDDAPDPYIPKRKASSTITGEVNIEVPKFFLGDNSGDNSETAV